VDRAVLPAPAGSCPEWGADELDLDAYLSRIGYDGPREPTLQTLVGIHRAHATTISWEILDMTAGRHVSLDLPSVQQKIVVDGRGGCCLETNLLFAAALDRLGFPLVRHIARVRRGSTQARTRSHAVLLVEVDGQLWLADPGFGDESPLEPIPFTDGATRTVGDWTWRLDCEGEDWVLRCLHADGWFDVYALRLEQHFPIDFDMINHFSYADPKSVFVGKLVVQRGDEKVRQVLKENVLTIQYADGRSESRQLTGEEIVEEMRDTFGIRLDAADQQFLRERY
jgi:N-hydroxyarylamine O-acetyltransferase